MPKRTVTEKRWAIMNHHDDVYWVAPDKSVTRKGMDSVGRGTFDKLVRVTLSYSIPKEAK